MGVTESGKELIHPDGHLTNPLSKPSRAGELVRLGNDRYAPRLVYGGGYSQQLDFQGDFGHHLQNAVGAP
jgi:hypothetical protein